MAATVFDVRILPKIYALKVEKAIATLSRRIFLCGQAQGATESDESDSSLSTELLSDSGENSTSNRAQVETTYSHEAFEKDYPHIPFLAFDDRKGFVTSIINSQRYLKKPIPPNDYMTQLYTKKIIEQLPKYRGLKQPKNFTVAFVPDEKWNMEEMYDELINFHAWYINYWRIKDAIEFFEDQERMKNAKDHYSDLDTYYNPGILFCLESHNIPAFLAHFQKLYRDEIMKCPPHYGQMSYTPYRPHTTSIGNQPS